MKKIFLVTLLTTVISFNSSATSRDNEVNEMYENSHAILQGFTGVKQALTIDSLLINTDNIISYAKLINNQAVVDEKAVEKHMIILMSELKLSWTAYLKTKKNNDLLKNSRHSEDFILSLIKEFDKIPVSTKQV